MKNIFCFLLGAFCIILCASGVSAQEQEAVKKDQAYVFVCNGPFLTGEDMQQVYDGKITESAFQVKRAIEAVKQIAPPEKATASVRPIIRGFSYRFRPVDKENILIGQTYHRDANGNWYPDGQIEVRWEEGQTHDALIEAEVEEPLEGRYPCLVFVSVLRTAPVRDPKGPSVTVFSVKPKETKDAGRLLQYRIRGVTLIPRYYEMFAWDSQAGISSGISVLVNADYPQTHQSTHPIGD